MFVIKLNKKNLRNIFVFSKYFATIFSNKNRRKQMTTRSGRTYSPYENDQTTDQDEVSTESVMVIHSNQTNNINNAHAVHIEVPEDGFVTPIQQMVREPTVPPKLEKRSWWR